MSNNELLAWAAGFIDGEGTFGIQKQVGRKYRIVYLQAGQVHREVLDKLCEAVECGKVYGPYTPRNAKHSAYHYFRLTSTAETAVVAAKLWPWLSEVKKQQYLRALEQLNG